MIGFRFEMFGLNLSKLDFEKNNFLVFIFQALSKMNSRLIKIINKNNQDHEMFSNSYII